MTFLRNLQIRQKVVFVVMLTVCVALLLAGVALLSYELRDFRAKLEGDLSTLSKIIGSNTVGAIDFGDAQAATETLSALKAEPQILGACIYLASGEIFARYSRAGAKLVFPPKPAPDGAEADGDRLRMFEPIHDERERGRVGTIYLEADFGGVRRRIQSYLGLLGLVLLTSGLVALVLSTWLQRYISAPILSLAGTSKLVTSRRDYSLRVPQDARDEVGQLISSFNEMLAQIQTRDEALRSAHDSLERRVQERTSELRQEVAERRRAEEELAHSLSLVNATLESTADGILVVDREGKVVSYNQNFLHMWRIPEEVIGHGADAALLESAMQQLKNPEAFRDKVAELYRQPEAESYDALEFTDGRLFERYSKPQRIDGESVGRVWSFRDITDRTRSEERIREQASLLDLAQDAIVVRDLNDVVLFWSKGAERIFGWPGGEVLGRPFAELLRTDRERLREAQRAVLATGHWAGDLPHRDQQGREIITESRWTLLRDGQHQPKSILIINTDVTERKKLEAQFLRSQRLESIGTLAGGIAHDLNNVLAPILMSIEVLRLSLKDQSLDDVVEAIEQSAQRGADLVRQILCFARGAEGKRIAVEADRIIKEVFKIARDTFPKNLTVTCKVAPNLWPICGDATQLHQVLLNLCVNARDVMPGGGELAITAENIVSDGSAAALQTTPGAGPHLLLRVSDTGSGIPEELREKIFEPFFTTKEVGKGTGLGLSTALTIVKAHGGFLDFSKNEPQGTVFTICLPAVPDAPKVKPDEALRPIGRDELVLFVDDEASVRLVVKQALEGFGYRVITAPDGVTAVALYTERRDEIALVVTDMMMPGMDGSATIAALKCINPAIRVIAASGLMTDDRVLRATEAGAVAFLRKPYSAETMLRTFSQVLATPGPN